MKSEKAEKLVLYHGTTGIIGDKIQLSQYSGVGWNAFTLGNGFYTTNSLPAAMLFGHLAEQGRWLNDRSLSPMECLDKAGNAGIGQVYEISLVPRTKILDATEPLPEDQVCEILKEAGVREDTLRSLSQHELSDLKYIKSLVERYTNRNGYEYLTSKMGCDALKITEDRWHTWDYYPSRLGLGADEFVETPTTIVIYNVERIKCFHELLIDDVKMKIGHKRANQKRFV